MIVSQWGNDATHNARLASVAVCGIISDLSGRRSLKWEWRRIDEDVRAEIAATWERLILDSFEGADVVPILKHFTFSHLPADLQAISRPICELAELVDDRLPDGAEKSAGLRKLLEAKDCLVRAAIEGRT